MTWGVDHVDGYGLTLGGLAAVGDGGVLGENGDSLFTLEVAGVHDSLPHICVVAERTGLAKHGIDQRGLAVVNVGNDCNVAKVFSGNQSHNKHPLNGTRQIERDSCDL